MQGKNRGDPLIQDLKKVNYDFNNSDCWEYVFIDKLSAPAEEAKGGDMFDNMMEVSVGSERYKNRRTSKAEYRQRNQFCSETNNIAPSHLIHHGTFALHARCRIWRIISDRVVV